MFITSRHVHISKLKSIITEGSLALILSFSRVGPGVQSPLIRLWSKPFYPLSHLTGPQVFLECSSELCTMLFFKATKTISTFSFWSQKIRWGLLSRKIASSLGLHIPVCTVSHPAAQAALEQTAVFLPQPGVRRVPPLPATVSAVKEYTV